MRGLGCLVPLALLAVLVGEGYICYLIGAAMGDYFGAIIAMVVLSIAGFQLARWRMRRMALMVMGGNPGRGFVALLGAALIVVPGFVTGAVGLLLQLPPLQAVFARLATRLVMGLSRTMAARMGSKGGFGGFAGGFPGGGFAGGFPGGGFAGPGKPGGLQPDERLGRFKGKTVDTTAERE